MPKSSAVPDPAAAFEEKVREWVDLYAPILGMSHTFIEIHFHDTCADFADAAAHFYRNLPYNNAHLYIHQQMTVLAEPFQERAIIHELAHDILQPIKGALHAVLVKEKFVTWREADDLVESTTDRIAQIVWEMVGGEGK